MKQILVEATISVEDHLYGFCSIPNRHESVSVEEAAKILDCSGQTIRRMCKSGLLRHMKAGNRYKVLVSELMAPVSSRLPAGHSTSALPRASAGVEGLHTIPTALPQVTANQQAGRTGDGHPSGQGRLKESSSGKWLLSPEEARRHEIMCSLHYNKRTGQWERRR